MMLPDNNNDNDNNNISDSKLIHLNYLIDEKKKYLMSKYHETYKAAQQNEFLEGVLKDYTQYRDVIISQKRNHIKALETIYRHVNRVKQTNELGKEVSRRHIHEQQNILSEIKRVKQELDDIVISLE
ncbi:hypothetical protein OAA60_03615 [Porticoccaceae bacterium]|nr:hypothetical protein [Porticoccaceae bacterium]